MTTNALSNIPSTPDELARSPLVNSRLTHARELQHQSGLSDVKFAGRWFGFSAATWKRILEGTYTAKDWAPVLRKFLSGYQRLVDHLVASKIRGDVNLIPLSTTSQLLDAVAVAQGEPRDRLVIFLAPTGGGKSSAFRQLADEYAGTVAIAEASEPWRDSYLAATLGVAAAIGLKGLATSKRAAENALLSSLAVSPKIIAIDEAHYFGRTTINLVKAILNQTASTVVLGAIPALWHRMRSDAWEEAAQLRSRTCIAITATEISVSDSEKFCRDRLPKFEGNIKQAATRIRGEANAFGRWDTAEAICVNARTEAGDHPITLEIVNSAIAETLAQRN